MISVGHDRLAGERALLEGIVAAVTVYAVAGGTELVLIKLLRPTETELTWVSDFMLSVALGMPPFSPDASSFVPARAFAQSAPQHDAHDEQPSSAALHATQGTVKSIDDTTLVVSRPHEHTSSRSR